MNIRLDKSTVDEITKALSDGAEDKVRMGYLTGQIQGENVIIEGVYVPKQESSRAYASVTAQHFVSDWRAILALNKDLVGLAQYNGKMSVFESAATNKCKEDFVRMANCPDILLIVNAKGEYQLF